MDDYDLTVPQGFARGDYQGIFRQPVMVQGPFHQGNTQLLCGGEFLAPMLPGKGLDLAVHLRRQPALHESDLVHRYPCTSPFTVQLVTWLPGVVTLVNSPFAFSP